MIDREQINVNVDNRLTSLETKFELFMEEMKQQREDIRRIQERQDAAQAKHDADIKEMNQRFYAKFDEMVKKIDSKFDKLSDQLHTMTIAAVVGFGAIAVAIGGLVVSALK